MSIGGCQPNRCHRGHAAMNPLRWSRSHQVALMIAVIIGAALAVVFGYLADSAGSGAEGGVGFGWWFGHPLRYKWPGWAAFGAAIALGSIYICQLTSD